MRPTKAWAFATLILVASITVLTTFGCSRPTGDQAAPGATGSIDAVSPPAKSPAFAYYLWGSTGQSGDGDTAHGSDRNSPLYNKVIAIDPGHGGNDPGALGRHGAYEKDLTLDMANRLETLLLAVGARPLIIRPTGEDVAMYERPAIVNQAGADVNVSIHLNWFKGSSVHGLEVYYYPTHPNSAALASSLHGRLLSQLGLTDRGISSDQAYVAVRETTVPSVLLEVGYLSNPGEEALLTTEAFRAKVATAIRDGLIDYFSGRGTVQ
ncbi:MAG TPA: N-acetylmuramoyl-L-alanine amidase [Bacillota bacterium]